MTEPVRRSVNANGVSLNVYALSAPVPPGPADEAKPPVVMLHGMRDVALSLMPVATRLAESHPVFLMDLRGHGGSDKPGNYALLQFVFDLHRVMTELVGEPAVLLGHSLGGHIVSRFGALFPELVRATVIVEGLGPPDARHAGDASTRLKMEGRRLIDTLSVPAHQRPLPSVAFAAERLLANNPRLDPDRALELARQGTTTDANGELNWAFDPRVGAVFLGGSASVEYWAQVRCPTCIVAGAHSAEYWGRAMPAGAEWQGAFAPGELEARAATFPDAELVVLQGSGHMVHFDEPDRLAEVTLDFLRRRL